MTQLTEEEYQAMTVEQLRQRLIVLLKSAQELNNSARQARDNAIELARMAQSIIDEQLAETDPADRWKYQA